MVADALARYLGKQPKLFLVAAGIIFSLVTGVLDYRASQDVSLEAFYLLPIFLVALFAGSWAGTVTAAVSAVSAIIVDVKFHPIIPYWDGAMTLAIFLGTARLGAALKRALEREQELARTDYLTGVANRRAFFESADQEISRVHRYQHPFTVAYFDLDNFKLMNDRFGHSQGDNLLRSVTEVIKRNIRTHDVIARLGGDEFVILLPETGVEAAEAVIRRAQKNLTEVMQEKGWPVTFSIGMVTFITPPETVDEMIKRADDMMYSAKRGGKNMIQRGVCGEPAPAPDKEGSAL